MSCPEPPRGISSVGSFPVQCRGFLIIFFKLFRCRNLALNRDCFPTFRSRHVGDCQNKGVCMPLVIAICPYTPYICMPLYTHCTSVCSLYTYVTHVMGIWGHLYTPYIWGSFGGHQDICWIFLCLSVHPFASQFITVIPVAPHHCGSLLYWTGCQ